MGKQQGVEKGVPVVQVVGIEVQRQHLQADQQEQQRVEDLVDQLPERVQVLDR